VKSEVIGRLSRRAWTTYVPYSIGIASNAFLNILLISTLTHRLSTTVYGSYSVSVTVLVLASSVVGQWLQQATGRYLSGSSRVAAQYTKAAVLVGLGCVLSSLIAISIPVVVFSVFYDVRHVSDLWLVCLFGIASQTGFTLVGTVLQAERKAWSFSGQQIGAGSLKIMLSIFIFHMLGQDVRALIYMYAVAQSAGFAFGAWRAKLFDGAVVNKLRSNRTFVVFRKLGTYGGAMTFWFIFMNLAMYCDRLLVRFLAGPAAAGLYGAAATLVVGSVSLVMAPILAATWPQLMAAWNTKNETAVSRLLGDLITYILCAGVVLVGVVATVAESATYLFLGPTFAQSSHLLPFLTASAFSFSIAPFFHKPMEFKEQKTKMILFAASSLTLNAFLDFIFIPRFGYGSASISACVAGFGYCALCVIHGRRIVKWRINASWVGTAGGAALLSYLIVEQISLMWHFDTNLMDMLSRGVAFLVCFAGTAGTVYLLFGNYRRPRGEALK
jgi:O-antigen/teichoic acid export membrane protein